MKTLHFLQIFIALKLINCQLTTLDEYVFNDNDIEYKKFQLLETLNDTFSTRYRLNITTLKWFDDTLSTGSVWWHDLYISVPNNLDSSKPIFYYIDSGTNNISDSIGKYVNPISKLSSDCNCITATIRQIPNQPIRFIDDTSKKNKIEDDIIAWTFKLFFTQRSKFPNETYKTVPLLFPMTKAAKRGMDIVTDFLRNLNIKSSEKFIVSGASKRGWTSWLVTAVETRVIGIIPVVYDLLKWNQNFHHQFLSLGGAYSFALFDYYSAGLTRNLDSIEYYELTKLIDPYSFLERYKDKKILLILATGDEFMMPENTKFFFRDLMIQTNFKSFIRRLPNTDHYLGSQGEKILASFKNFINLQSSNNISLPNFTWKLSNNATHGNIDVTISNLDSFDAYQINGYYAETLDNTRRDFRAHVVNSKFEIIEQPIIWKSELLSYNLNLNSLGPFKQRYSISRDFIKNKYVGFFVQVSLKLKNQTFTRNINENQLFVISTDVNVIPEYNPIEDCVSNECFGKLV